MRSSLLLLCLHCSALELGAGLQVAQDCTVAELQALVKTFETADARLVMVSPDTDTTARQEELVKSGAIGKVECAMHPGNKPDLHALGAELAAYLAVFNPANRAAIGGTPGVLTQLAKLVNYSVHFDIMDDIVVKDAENAAEAIAILAKADANNIKTLGGTSAASDLAAMLERADGKMTPKGYMWAGVALGNLMAEFDAEAATSYSQAVQRAMAGRPNFVGRLVNLTRMGTVQSDTPANTMPGAALRTEAARTYPHIYGWGVMHAIRNLALAPEGRAQLKAEPGAHELFCALTMSPDPLEKMKAEAIVAIASWGCDGANNFLAHEPKPSA